MVLLGAGCGSQSTNSTGNTNPVATSNQATNQTASPPAVTPQGGPYFHSVASATSADGLTFTADGATLLEHASVPVPLVLSDGTIRLYYVDATVGPENVNCADSSDGGKTFTVRNCTIANKTADHSVDPSIVQLPDGRFRLYYFGVTKAGVDAPGDHSIYSAISDDGISFTEEQAVFTYAGLVDPDVWWDGTQWVMYVFSGQGAGTIVATSADGLNFGTGQFRLYGFEQGPGKQKEFLSYLSDDGGSLWTQEAGVRLTAPTGYDFSDPQVVKLSDGTWKMFYKMGPEQKPGGNQKTPPPPAGQ